MGQTHLKLLYLTLGAQWKSIKFINVVIFLKEWIPKHDGTLTVGPTEIMSILTCSNSSNRFKIYFFI